MGFLTSGVGTLKKACLVKACYLMGWIVKSQNFFSSAIVCKMKERLHPYPTPGLS